MRRGIGSAAVLAGCLLLVAVLTALQAPQRPGVRDVGPGPDGWAVSGDAAARVDGVRLARVVQPPGESTRQLATSLVFVVVELSVRASGTAQPFSTIELATTDGHVYLQRDDPLIPSVTLTQPGYTMHALRVTGLIGVLEVYHARLRFPDVVPRGLEVATQTRLRAATTEVTPRGSRWAAGCCSC